MVTWDDYLDTLTLSDADEEAVRAEDDAFCEDHGHMPGCPHDITDWDAINKEARYG